MLESSSSGLAFWHFQAVLFIEYAGVSIVSRDNAPVLEREQEYPKNLFQIKRSCRYHLLAT